MCTHLLAGQDDFTAVVENSDGKELKLYVYNTKTERVREVSALLQCSTVRPLGPRGLRLLCFGVEW